MQFWQARDQSWSYLKRKHRSRVSVVSAAFDLVDRCVDEYESHAPVNTYARICGLTLLKAKNLALGSLSLALDGLGQEAGALLRPMIEYAELLTYLHKFPEAAEKAALNELPKAGQRAKAIGGIYQNLREHLNEHASHSSYSHYSLSHLLTPELSFRKEQQFVPHVLERNLRDFTVQLLLLLQEGVVALEHVAPASLTELGLSADRLKNRAFDVFQLNEV